MKTCINFLRRSFSGVTSSIPKISIVGAGPAGFYTAQYLLKKLCRCEIDIFEKLPVPFGLVRFGVAPDHPEVKNVENSFTKVAEHSSIRFLGNVSLGRDISLEELRNAYHIVILAYGAEENRNLNIPGENLKNVLSARRIVGWYNGVPSDRDIPINLNGEKVAIFGQGNVAIDVARILLTPVDELKKTDITEHSLDVLSKSNVKTIYLIGRRGPLQAAFTIKELREILKLKYCQTEWNFQDFNGLQDVVNNLPRPRKRLTELMLKSAFEISRNSETKFKPLFLRTPIKFIGDSSVRAVELGITKLEGEDILHQKAVLTGSQEILDCHMGVVSIGYKSKPPDSDIAFDDALGVVKNKFGKIDKGLYATGWLATGAVGVLLNTMNNSFFLAESVLKDIEKDSIANESRPGYRYVEKILNKRNVQIVTWKDWMNINSYEIQEGLKRGKPREKVVDIAKMLKMVA
ncbi:hypothetical protein WA026_010225 [Henosepilachna vigintioctopunctata]|uniref:NADPH:adrenodoxin oxidoreductase, mitochondrial n=1 Tax=Henosepilachna vigintioctopunctata TaxID=420089 RepID=A0AAW1UJU8_9CUCU